MQTLFFVINIVVDSKYIGDFKFHESGEDEPVVNNDAAVFVHSKGKLFMYRGKDGDWLIGIDKMK